MSATIARSNARTKLSTTAIELEDAEPHAVEQYLASFDKARRAPTSAAPSERRVGATTKTEERPDPERVKVHGGWPSLPRPRFVLKQEWIGRVEDVGDEYFKATLSSRSAPGELDQAEIELDELSPTDLGRLRPGAVFYWVVGYRDEPYGQRIGVSTIIFRHMVAPNDEQVAEAHQEADDLITFLDRAHASDAETGTRS